MAAEAGMIVVLSGPSGVGKNTVGEELLRRMPEMARVVTATTREVRGTERDGVDYHFWSAEAFQAAIEKGLLLEWADVLGKFYGTPLASVVENLRAGKTVLLIIDVVGARQVKEIVPEVFMVFLHAPEGEELERRLRGRGTEDEAKISRRLERARREIELAGEYDAQVVNDDIERCVEEVKGLITARRRQAEESSKRQVALRRLESRLAGAGN